MSFLPPLGTRKYLFEHIVHLPPSDVGYFLIYQRCCRNINVVNLYSSGGKGITFFTTIPPFSSGECPNSSPVFKNLPPQIVCENSPFNFDLSATDIDGDSLVYRLCPSLLGATGSNPRPYGDQIPPPPYTSVQYVTGRPFDAPVSGAPAFGIDPKTGYVNCKPTDGGTFQIKVCVDEYRNDSLLNTISRDFQIRVSYCEKNIFANTPLFSTEPNVYMIQCKSYTVPFKNTSLGGTEYFWDFGDGQFSTDFEPTHTYDTSGYYNVKLETRNPETKCADSIYRTVKVFPFFNADFDTEGKLCPNTPIQFLDSTITTYQSPVRYEWALGDGDSSNLINPVHSFEDAGKSYEVQMIAINGNGCRDTITKPITIVNFIPFAGKDTFVVYGNPYRLNATGGTDYVWSPPELLDDRNTPNPLVSFPDTGSYLFSVDVADGAGCAGSDTINVILVRDSDIYLPSAFSPNGDGLNDVFRPLFVGYPYLTTLRIFNRLGQEVFVSFKNSDGWDGTYNGQAAAVGVYKYITMVTQLDGSNAIRKGDITLIR